MSSSTVQEKVYFVNKQSLMKYPAIVKSLPNFLQEPILRIDAFCCIKWPIGNPLIPIFFCRNLLAVVLQSGHLHKSTQSRKQRRTRSQVGQGSILPIQLNEFFSKIKDFNRNYCGIMYVLHISYTIYSLSQLPSDLFLTQIRSRNFLTAFLDRIKVS